MASQDDVKTQELLRDLRQFADAHTRNGERRTADLLTRAAEYISPKRNIIGRQEWDALLAEEKQLEAQLARYTLPAQRGARNQTKAKRDAIAAKIRAVDGVIGIDAWASCPARSAERRPI